MPKATVNPIKSLIWELSKLLDEPDVGVVLYEVKPSTHWKVGGTPNTKWFDAPPVRREVEVRIVFDLPYGCEGFTPRDTDTKELNP